MLGRHRWSLIGDGDLDRDFLDLDGEAFGLRDGRLWWLHGLVEHLVLVILPLQDPRQFFRLCQTFLQQSILALNGLNGGNGTVC